VRDECEAIGRNPSEIELSASLGKPDPDLIRRFEDIGVSRLVIAPPGFDAEALKRGLGTFADALIAKS
jgi:hypothetical protein